MDGQDSHSKVILVVEDSPTQALHLQTLLEMQGLRVLLAGDGKTGLALAYKALPDLVVLDMMLPEMDGLEVCRVLKSAPQTENIPIIMFTASEDQEMMVDVLQLGVVDFILKDVFADAVLLGTLQQMGVIASANS
ncbi:MAG: response regulator [Anaerolineae bacterium]|nr:response regulator [Anaerolineae bacterium]